jgi:hypothetical protein
VSESTGNWDAQWNMVIFTDESRFWMHDGRQRIRRLREERRNPTYSAERHVARTVGVGNSQPKSTIVRTAQQLKKIVGQYTKYVVDAYLELLLLI